MLGASTYDGLIPDSSRSLKSIFSIYNNQAEANSTDALQLVNPAVSSYQYTILSETYPQKDVAKMQKLPGCALQPYGAKLLAYMIFLLPPLDLGQSRDRFYAGRSRCSACKWN